MNINHDYTILVSKDNIKQIADVFTSFGLDWVDFSASILDIVNRVGWRAGNWNYMEIYVELFNIFNYWGFPDGEGEFELATDIIVKLATLISEGELYES